MTYVLGRSAPVAGKTDFHRPALSAVARLWGSSTVLAGLPLLLALCLLWEVAPRLGWMNPIFFPPLSAVLSALWDLIASGEMARHIGISFERAGLGFLLATVVAIPLGFLMGRYAAFEKATDLLVQTLRNTSQFALLPVFVLLLGIGEASKIAITFYAAVFFLLVNTIVGVKSVDSLLLKAAKSMGTSDWDLFRKVIFPSAIPSIVAGMRLGVKASLFSVIAAEMLAARSGIGFLIQNAQLMLKAADMYAGILVLTFVGLLLNYALVWIERRATHWRADAGDQPH
ncbi:ABC-type nitrate/sulfonate/bicarbonate transport system, permease component [Rubellimicrobium mesophilum DSM 19309]|uniref:ABC-type nitrate/sulfonate/bicarbonate transport system, permease component n=1 Tax=Rubellimicrobium mesophilum DSM 19309 TaxID=442562 RepID=A0A017HQF8_9RHOB|nr:ABC transporter permease [Rubellimicrobium mesophilum]EYD76413.1 ABC-type nitrate/sulfonate/bicarbonate transport system, permease component [Rubellimicrobium mesophilum DSM 19309]